MAILAFANRDSRNPQIFSLEYHHSSLPVSSHSHCSLGKNTSYQNETASLFTGDKVEKYTWKNRVDVMKVTYSSDVFTTRIMWFMRKFNEYISVPQNTVRAGRCGALSQFFGHAKPKHRHQSHGYDEKYVPPQEVRWVPDCTRSVLLSNTVQNLKTPSRAPSKTD